MCKNIRIIKCVRINVREIMIGNGFSSHGSPFTPESFRDHSKLKSEIETSGDGGKVSPEKFRGI